jgi:hypothetical protein
LTVYRIVLFGPRGEKGDENGRPVTEAFR